MRNRSFALSVLLLVIALSLVVGSAGCGANLGQVQLTSGPVTGLQQQVQDQDIWVFKGIPYAAPPVGDLRWKPPQPVVSWTEPRPCTTYGPSCPQSGDAGPFALESLSVGETSEDCLYLNVWTPAESPDDRFPVMVWIHGGSFETGSGSMGVYDGGNLATRGVVVVTINYRIGPLGFLAHPALSAESNRGVSGNYGLLDQLVALSWVRENIAGFGGDPTRVTVFGESAGAISILDLMVSPLAKGLFQGAIPESGILLDKGFGVATARRLEQGEAEGEEFAGLLGVDPSGDVLAQMRAKTPDELLAAADALSVKTSLVEQGLVWTPVADGWVLPDLPSTLWVEGKQMPISLLIGSNADEGNAFLSGLKVSAEDYDTTMGHIFGDYADEALALYPMGSGGDTLTPLSRMLTEVGFASTARFAAEQTSSGGADAFVYEFTRVPLKPLNTMGAFHGVEIPYVFGNLDMFALLGQVADTDYKLSDTIMDYWVRFAETGDPNGGAAPEWPLYSRDIDLHLALGDTVEQAGPGLYKEACDLADRIRGMR
jgi:para-nitrobenzyl esterase